MKAKSKPVTPLTLQPKPLKANCPYKVPGGEYICVEGVLWSLSHSEMGPPDQRQAWSDCPRCKPIWERKNDGLGDG